MVTILLYNFDSKTLVFNVPLALLLHQVFELVSEIQIHNNAPLLNVSLKARHYER